MKKLVPVAISAAMFFATTAFADTISPNDVKIVDGEIKQSLTGKPGDAENGKIVFAGRKAGNCLACHINADMANESFQGEVGPEMNGVAERWEPAQLRAIIVNSKAVFGDETIMPGFYRDMDKAGFRIAEKFQGKTIISAQDVEDVVAYLMTLK